MATLRACQRTPCLGLSRRRSVVVRASTATSASTSRRSLLLAGLIAVPVAELFSPSVRNARAAEAAADFGEQGVDEYARLEASGKLSSAKALDSFRLKYNFKRGVDGRVYVKGSKGTFFAVRLDMEVPGAMLFRDTSSGNVYALQTETLQQIDLSSDQVIILLLGDGQWEQEMSPIQFEDEKGNTKTLTLSENDFRNVIGLINMAEGNAEGEAEAK